MKFYYLIYISTSERLMLQDELEAILEKSRLNNAKKSITGILLYSHGVFMQALEGSQEHVEAIYNTITHDTRHKNLIKLVAGYLDERIFPTWSMAFVALEPEKMSELESYINPLHEELFKKDSDHRAIMLLRTFIEHNALSSGDQLL